MLLYRARPQVLGMPEPERSLQHRPAPRALGRHATCALTTLFVHSATESRRPRYWTATVSRVATSDSSSERLLNLVIALLNTSTAMTKENIRRAVAGYDVPASDEAFFRMLERDKAVLRTLGVPIVTVGTDGHVSEIGYRIDSAAYEAHGLHLNGTQLAVLGMAAELWRGQALRSDMNRALTKLRALGGDDDDPIPLPVDLVPSVTPPQTSRAADYDAIVDAMSTHRRIQFSYRSASQGVVARRHVEPWRIAVRSGGWYLVGRDVDRQAPRVFHLARIESAVKAVGPEDAFVVPFSERIDEALAGVTPAHAQKAILAVLPNRGGSLRSRGTPTDQSAAHRMGLEGRDTFEVPYWSLPRFAAEIAAYGEAVLVVKPAALRTAVIERLQHALDLPARMSATVTSTADQPATDAPDGGDRNE